MGIWAKPPVEIPGTSIRPPSKPGSQKCPNCGRKYKRIKIKQGKKTVVKRCPFCGAKV
jgi:predicted RNA-binding Zn-ribbon protein involved in translation (DUF1610 family)